MLRKLPLLILTLLISLFVLSQVTRVDAQMLPLTGPLTPPVTTIPTVTPPVTAPVTNPVTDFNLTGQVMYKQLGRLFGNMQRLVPAKNVLVTIQNFFNPNQKYTTHTDQSGKYGVELPNGIYQVTIDDNTNTFFVPPFKVVNIKNNDKTANFEGLLFPHFGL